MKKLLSLVTLGMVLSACGSVAGGFLAGPAAPYNIALSSLGYEVDPQGIITIPEVRATLTSTAGAHDIYDVKYTAVLLDRNGGGAAGNNSTIVPASGQLLSYAKGGYLCATTAATACTINSTDAYFAANNTFPGNTVVRSITPGEWAVAHIQRSGLGDTAQWYARFTFTGTVDGRSYSWTQDYQFVSPAGGE